MPEQAPSVGGSLSSTPNTKPVPPEIQGWSWGAAGLTWIWGIKFEVWIAFLSFVPFINGIWWIVLGIKGNEWAWKAKPWNSVEEFKQATKPWNKWGMIVFILSIIAPFLFIGLMFNLFFTASVLTNFNGS